MIITKLDQVLEVLKSRPKKRLVAAYSNDAHTIEAVNNAIEIGIIDAILVGDENIIRQVCESEKIDASKFRIVHEPNEVNAAKKAVELVNKGEADLIMKGLVSTDKYMKAILNKETGLMDPGAILTHVTVVENQNYHKLLILADVAIIPLPDLKQKVAITNYLINTAKSLGIETPKVALIAATEQMLPDMQACVDAAIISKMNDRGQIKGAIVDGPLALDVAVDLEAATIKGVKNPVAGDADCLVFPNIEAGNVFYKYCGKLAKCKMGAFVAGARVPAVLTSRGDTAHNKLYSIALAALSAK
jgi:phosphate butyryltransferase